MADQARRSINVARKTAFLVCALCVVPVMCVPRLTNMWAAVFLVGLAAAAHAGFSANLYTIVSDTVPRKAVSSVVGHRRHGRLLGHVAVVLADRPYPRLDRAVYGRKDYLIPFVIAGSVYLIATAVIHLLLPRLEPMTFSAKATRE